MLSIEGSGKHMLTLAVQFFTFFLNFVTSTENEKAHRTVIGGPGPESAHLVFHDPLLIGVGPSHMVRLQLQYFWKIIFSYVLNRL